MNTDRLKCRVWDKTPIEGGGGWLDPEYLWLRADGRSYMYYENGSLLHYSAERIIRQQCTGLKDKNGQLIYEGDIIKPIEDWRDTVYIVKFGEGEFDSGVYRFRGFYLQMLGGGQAEDWHMLSEDSGRSCKPVIIGNILENPELLEENKEKPQ